MDGLSGSEKRSREKRNAASQAKIAVQEALNAVKDEEGEEFEEEDYDKDSEEDDFLPPQERKRRALDGPPPVVVRQVQTLPWLGLGQASILHVHLDVMGKILQQLSVRSLVALKSSSLYLYRCAVAELARRALDTFGVADFRATIWNFIFKEVEINLGQAQLIFGLTKEQALDLPHRIEERGRVNTYTVYIYKKEVVISRALERHGSIANLMAYRKRKKKGTGNGETKRRVFSKALARQHKVFLNELPLCIRSFVVGFRSGKANGWTARTCEVGMDLVSELQSKFPGAHGENLLDSNTLKELVESYVQGKISRSEVVDKATEMYLPMQERINVLKQMFGKQFKLLTKGEILAYLDQWSDATIEKAQATADRWSSRWKLAVAVKNMFGLRGFDIPNFAKEEETLQGEEEFLRCVRSRGNWEETVCNKIAVETLYRSVQDGSFRKEKCGIAKRCRRVQAALPKERQQDLEQQIRSFIADKIEFAELQEAEYHQEK